MKTKHVSVGDDHDETIWIDCKLGKIDEVVDRLNNGFPVNQPDSYGNTPLYYACLCGHYKLVEILLNKGAKDDAVQRAYYNSLNLNIRHLLKGKITTEDVSKEKKKDENDEQEYSFKLLLPVSKSLLDDVASPLRFFFVFVKSVVLEFHNCLRMLK
jgi:ankyrin repeat protein